MNDVGRLPASIGMTNLADPGNNYDNPMNGTTKSTGWHLYYDASYADTPSGSNAWVSQIVNTAGTHKWWVRSRNGGTITDGTEWNAGWRHLVVSPQAGQGGTTTPIYVDANGHTQNCSYTISKSVPADAVFTDNDTKNTAGSTDTSSKIFLVGATSQAANSQTYSDNEVYATSGTLTSAKTDTKAIIARTGTGTAGADKGSGVSPRYIPSLWTFNAGVTVANGEVYFIKIPVAGGTYGVWMSLNNGTNYYPVAISSGTGRFTTHYAANTVIAVTYESAGKCTCYPKAGGDSTSSVTGIFRVLNDYDSGNTNTNVTQTATTTSADYEVLFSATADNTTRTEGARKNSNLKFNPSTGNLTVTKVNGESVKYTSSVNAVVGDTTCTISDSSIATTSLIEPFSSNSTGDTIAIKNIAVTAGQAVLTFKALTVDTSFKLRVTNV